MKRSRRAAALLLVLGAIVVILPAAVIASRATTTAKLHDTTTENVILADELAQTGESVVLDWLAIEATSIVISPDAPTAGLVLLNKTWAIDDRQLTLTITAWDQRGMLSTGLVRSNRFGRSELLSEAVETLREFEGSLDGLDRLVGVSDSRVYPRTPDDIAIGGLVATQHTPQTNSQRRREQSPSIMINLNTVPIDLLRAIYRDAGLGGIDEIVHARREGKPVTHTPGSVEIDSAEDTSRVRFITMSDRWSVRIDAVIDRVRRSWWIVFEQNRYGWKVVQRLAIAE